MMTKVVLGSRGKLGQLITKLWQDECHVLKSDCHPPDNERDYVQAQLTDPQLFNRLVRKIENVHEDHSASLDLIIYCQGLLQFYPPEHRLGVETINDSIFVNGTSSIIIADRIAHYMDIDAAGCLHVFLGSNRCYIGKRDYLPYVLGKSMLPAATLHLRERWKHSQFITLSCGHMGHIDIAAAVHLITADPNLRLLMNGSTIDLDGMNKPWE